MSEVARKMTEVAAQIEQGEVDHEELYRIPASESYPHGAEVGFVATDEFFFAANWSAESEVSIGHFGAERGEAAFFPSLTEWMITNNSAIDYGLEVDSETKHGALDDTEESQ